MHSSVEGWHWEDEFAVLQLFPFVLEQHCTHKQPHYTPYVKYAYFATRADFVVRTTRDWIDVELQYNEENDEDNRRHHNTHIEAYAAFLVSDILPKYCIHLTLWYTQLNSEVLPTAKNRCLLVMAFVVEWNVRSTASVETVSINSDGQSNESGTCLEGYKPKKLAVAST